ncbi:MAG TPA: metallophosphoesterase [Stellaceae bacterium]|nr:metallophosphoesterase [Stellaceae bacterium]
MPVLAEIREPAPADAEADVIDRLARRLGLHAHRRLRIEADLELRARARRFDLLQLDSWRPVLRAGLKLSGLYWRARRNAARIEIHENIVRSPRLPAAFDGFTILHISDLHVDTNDAAMFRLGELLPPLVYDICVLTGDFRGHTFGAFDRALAGLARVCAHFSAPAYGVLGNHDSVRMVPPIEDLGIRMLVNECDTLTRGGDRLYLAGIDDAHLYRMDNLEKAAAAIPDGAFATLLSHTPEVYRQAADTGFDLLLAGHTHGGQLCLPGGVPLTLDAVLPRHMGSGAWKYGAMAGYTSVGVGACVEPVRLNCPPAITLHRLRRS